MAERRRPKAKNGKLWKSEAFTIRITEDLRANLERAAKNRGNSLNNEISVRLESSFSEERAFGGPKLTQMIHLLASRFITQGHQVGETLYGPEVSEDQWLSDPYCFDNAMLAVFDALLARRPTGPVSEMISRVRGRMSQMEATSPKPEIESGWKQGSEKDRK
jgi:hypothetical protein